MLKELNNIRFFAIFSIILLTYCKIVYGVDSLYNSVKKDLQNSCKDEIYKICPYANDKIKQRECLKQKKSSFSQVCQNYFDSKINNAYLDKYTQQDKSFVHNILYTSCQDDVINICKAKIKRNNLEIKNESLCLIKLVKKEKQLTRQCAIALTSFIKNKSNNKSNNNTITNNNLTLRSNNNSFFTNSNKSDNKNKQETTEKQTIQNKKSNDDTGEEYIYLNDNIKVKKKHLMNFRGQFAEQIRNMDGNEAMEFEKEYLKNNKMLETDNDEETEDED